MLGCEMCTIGSPTDITEDEWAVLGASIGPNASLFAWSASEMAACSSAGEAWAMTRTESRASVSECSGGIASQSA